jgi:Tfp pilus assembly protein PilV
MMLATWLKRTIKNQTGATLVELIISLVVMGFILLVLSGFSVQVIRLTLRNRNHLIAVREAQNIGTWICRDGQQSEPSFISYDNDPATEDVLTLGWDYTAFYSMDDATIVYKLQNRNLVRYQLSSGVETSLVIANDVDEITISTAYFPYFIASVKTSTGGFESVEVTREYAFLRRSVGYDPLGG